MLPILVNVGGGVLAVLAGPLLEKTTGVFYSGKIESFQKFGWNVLGCLVYFVWHAVFAVLMLAPFACLKKISYKANSAGKCSYFGDESTFQLCIEEFLCRGEVYSSSLVEDSIIRAFIVSNSISL